MNYLFNGDLIMFEKLYSQLKEFLKIDVSSLPHPLPYDIRKILVDTTRLMIKELQDLIKLIYERSN